MAKSGNKWSIFYCKERIYVLEKTVINAPTAFGRKVSRKILVEERRLLNKLLTTNQ